MEETELFSDDPLQNRINLMMDLTSQLSWPNDLKSSIKQDVTILNSFALAEDWEKVELLIKSWSTKAKDPSLTSVASKKWDISLEIAIDAADMKLIQKLLEICGKQKAFKIRLPLMAIALEKQNDDLTNMLLASCSQQKNLEDDGMLASLPENQVRARQILFDRYCIADNRQLIDELFEDMKFPVDIEPEDLEELATEHRAAMISYLSRGSEPIIISQDTYWNSIRSGNGQLANLLKLLKMESNFVWMESATPTADTISVYNSSNSIRETQTLMKDEKWNTFMALYAAYGGRLSSVDPKVRRDLHRSGSFSSYRSRTDSMCSRNSNTSTFAKEVINSADDKGWLMYLRGETENLPGLSWMEPSLFSTTDTLPFKTSATPEPEFVGNLEAQAILHGLGGTVAYS